MCPPRVCTHSLHAQPAHKPLMQGCVVRIHKAPLHARSQARTHPLPCPSAPPPLAANAKKASPGKKPSPAKKAASPPKAAASAGKKASPPKAAPATASSSQKERLTGGKELVGQRVKVYWDGDAAWYKGEVVAFSESDSKHKGEPEGQAVQGGWIAERVRGRRGQGEDGREGG